MRKLAYIATLILVLVSCGVDRDKFKLEGHLLNLNQGEFYVYTPDGSKQGFDTIKVQAGRFSYETICEEPTIGVIVFPNYFEQVVFMQPGKKVKISGDASHLKEIEVKGTADNELMSEFREQIKRTTNTQVLNIAHTFISENPKSVVSVYLLYHYFINTTTPNYTLANKLLKPLLQAQPQNSFLVKLQQKLSELARVEIGKTLPAFSVTDIKGSLLTNKSFQKAPCAVISVWASWDYESINQYYQIKEKLEKSNGRLFFASFNVDASKKECLHVLGSDPVTGQVVCEEDLLGGKVMRKLSLFAPQNNIVLRYGKVVATDLNTEQLREKVNQLLH